MDQCTFELSAIEGKISEAHIGGDWVMGNTVPSFKSVMPQLAKQGGVQLVLKSEHLGRWDSRFVVFLFDLEAYCKEHDIALNMKDLPAAAQGLLYKASAFPVR